MQKFYSAIEPSSRQAVLTATTLTNRPNESTRLNATIWPAVCGPALSAPAPADLLRLLLLAPLLEEWIVRAGLQAWLLQRPRLAGRSLAAPLIAAGAFSALHLGAGWQAAALVFWPGLVLGLVYQRWRDWRLCALVHAAFNALAVSVCASPF